MNKSNQQIFDKIGEILRKNPIQIIEISPMACTMKPMNKTPQITIRMPVSNNISCLLEKANGQRFLFSIKGAMQSLEKDETSIRILTREGKVIAEKVNINSA